MNPDQKASLNAAMIEILEEKIEGIKDLGIVINIRY